MWVTPRAASCSTILLATVGVPAGVAAPSSGTNADLGAEQMGKTYPREGMEQCALLLLVVYVVAGGHLHLVMRIHAGSFLSARYKRESRLNVTV